MVESKTKQVTNREVKASAFTTYFSDPKNAAQLYSALGGVEVSPEDIQYTTLEGVLFVARKNDMAFTVRNKVLVISEHQSTINLNMPLRSVIYYGRTVEKLIEPRALYRKGAILIPTPEFYVFYNGDEPYPSENILKLSDVYLEKTTTPMLELSVSVININLPEGHAILEQCRPLYEYSWFIQRIKDYLGMGMLRDVAITRAIEDCEAKGILADFVREHGSEAVNMLFTQFNMEDALEVSYKEGSEDGAMKQIIEKTCLKLEKGKGAEMIADELEEDKDLIGEICAVAQKCGSYDVERIFSMMQTYLQLR